MGLLFENTPQVFGAVHLIILAVIGAVCAVLGRILRRMSRQQLTRFIGILGMIMLLMEAWKQWFVPHYVYVGIRSAWFFPWQLCSMAMYCAALFWLISNRRSRFFMTLREALLVFLSTYTVIAALGALIFPYDMMRPQVWLFVHSFIYHAMMLWISEAAFYLIKPESTFEVTSGASATALFPRFWPAILLFGFMAVIAEVINIVSHQLIDSLSHQANMFNITPYYPSTQPVFHQIALTLGIIPEIFIYLGFITLLSYGLYWLERWLIQR